MTRTDQITWFARAGLVAKAVVYCTLGGLALQAALGNGPIPSQQNVAQQLDGMGAVLLWATAIGLLLYAIWRVAQATGVSGGKKDSDGKKETAKRLGAAGSALANGILAALFGIIAVRGTIGGGGSGSGAWAGLLDSAWGRVLIGLVGLAFLAAGAYQFLIAHKERYMQRINTPHPKAQRMLRKLGKFGYAARGVVFGIVGYGLLVSALQAAQADYTSLGGALRQLAEQSYGPWLLGLVALGLLAYGVVATVMGRYVRAEHG